MSWECGACSQPESARWPVDAVCHHCGTLLCREHQHWLWDTAFSGHLLAQDRLAVHCQDCRDAYHSVPARWGASPNQ